MSIAKVTWKQFKEEAECLIEKSGSNENITIDKLFLNACLASCASLKALKQMEEDMKK